MLLQSISLGPNFEDALDTDLTSLHCDFNSCAPPGMQRNQLLKRIISVFGFITVSRTTHGTGSVGQWVICVIWVIFHIRVTGSSF